MPSQLNQSQRLPRQPHAERKPKAAKTQGDFERTLWRQMLATSNNDGDIDIMLEMGEGKMKYLQQSLLLISDT